MAAGVGGGVVVDEGELGVGKLVGHGGKGGIGCLGIRETFGTDVK